MTVNVFLRSKAKRKFLIPRSSYLKRAAIFFIGKKWTPLVLQGVDSSHVRKAIIIKPHPPNPGAKNGQLEIKASSEDRDQFEKIPMGLQKSCLQIRLEKFRTLWVEVMGPVTAYWTIGESVNVARGTYTSSTASPFYECTNGIDKFVDGPRRETVTALQSEPEKKPLEGLRWTESNVQSTFHFIFNLELSTEFYGPKRSPFRLFSYSYVCRCQLNRESRRARKNGVGKWMEALAILQTAPNALTLIVPELTLITFHQM